MTTINLQETHNCRVEWVQSSIMGLFDLPHRPEKYNTLEKWEDTITTQAEEEPIKEIKKPAQDTTTYNPFTVKATTISIALTIILLILLAKYGI